VGKPAPATPKEYGRLLTPAERDARGRPHLFRVMSTLVATSRCDFRGDINEIEGHPTRGLTTDQILVGPSQGSVCSTS
jgi:hypothetical protein